MMHTASRNYHAFMSCTAEPGWLLEARRQLGEWLREKKDIDIDLSGDVLLDADDRSFRLQHHRDGHSRGLRAQLTERATDTGTWTTDLVACDRRNGDGSTEGRMAVVDVADDGPGIAPDVLPRLFNRFATTRGPGQPGAAREPHLGLRRLRRTPGHLVTWANKFLSVTLQVVKRTDKTSGFLVLPRRWIVERTFGWITKHRRCVRGYETLPDHHEAMVDIAVIMTMSR